jgi:hypothetical protein
MEVPERFINDPDEGTASHYQAAPLGPHLSASAAEYARMFGVTEQMVANDSVLMIGNTVVIRNDNYLFSMTNLTAEDGSAHFCDAKTATINKPAYDACLEIDIEELSRLLDGAHFTYEGQQTPISAAFKGHVTRDVIYSDQLSWDDPPQLTVKDIDFSSQHEVRMIWIEKQHQFSLPDRLVLKVPGLARAVNKVF